MIETASIFDMEAWARGIMAFRQPDFVIGEGYLNRWFIVPRNELGNVYLHEFCRSDDDRAFHDHPWDSTSLILSGRYIEHTPEGSFMRQAGETHSRVATAMHRIELLPGERAITLFFTGPKLREWGFDCPQGWRHWRDFCAGENGEVVGRGCEP